MGEANFFYFTCLNLSRLTKNSKEPVLLNLIRVQNGWKNCKRPKDEEVSKQGERQESCAAADSSCIENRLQKAGESSVREASKELRHRTRYSAQEGSYSLRSLAQVCPSSAPEGCPFATSQSSSPDSSVFDD